MDAASGGIAPEVPYRLMKDHRATVTLIHRTTRPQVSRFFAQDPSKTQLWRPPADFIGHTSTVIWDRLLFVTAPSTNNEINWLWMPGPGTGVSLLSAPLLWTHNDEITFLPSPRINNHG